MARRPERKGGLRADPDTVEWAEGAAKNRAAMTYRQLYDAERVRVRVDVPDWLKRDLTNIAKEQGTSVSQIGAFGLAWWLSLYEQNDPDLLDVLGTSLKPSRSIKVENDVDLGTVIERLTKSAKG